MGSFTPQMDEGFFLVLQVGEFFYSKIIFSPPNFGVGLKFFSSAAKLFFFFFFTPDVSEVFFLASTAGEVLFFFKFPCPLLEGVPLICAYLRMQLNLRPTCRPTGTFSSNAQSVTRLKHPYIGLQSRLDFMCKRSGHRP